MAWLEPVREGGKARWIGGGREFSADLAQAIRTVLEKGEVTHVTLSKRAITALEDIRDSIPSTVEAVQVVSPVRYKVWTFAGSAANRTRMLHETTRGTYKFDGLSVDYRRDPHIEPQNWSPRHIDEKALIELAKSIKFNEMLPIDYALKTIRQRRLTACFEGKISLRDVVNSNNSSREGVE